MKRLEQTISILDMLDLLKDCKEDKNNNLSKLDFIEYSNLIFKYRDQTEKLLDLENYSFEYFIYKNILEQDRDKYLEMVDKYFMLNKDFKKHYGKKTLYKESNKLVKEDIVNKMVEKPNEMKDILINCLEEIAKNRNYFKGIDVNSKNLLNRATHQHVYDKSFYFLNLLSKAFADNKDFYEDLLDNKELNVDLCNNYFQYALKNLSNKFETELLTLKQYFNDNKNDYILKKKVAELDNMDDFIIKNVLRFLRDSNNNSFRNYVRRNKELSKYSYDAILNKIKLIDDNLYKSIMTKEIKRNDVIINYLENDYSSFDYYLKVNNISKDSFNVLLENIKEVDPLNYYRFVAKYNDQVVNYDEKVNEVLAIANNITNGILDNNGNLRDYNFLDYNLDTSLSLDEFILIFRNEPFVKRDDLIKVLKFARKQLSNTATNSFEPAIMSDTRIKSDYYGVKDRMVTDDEKKAVIRYIDDHNFKRYQKLYEQIIRLYFAGELDLSNYFDEDKTSEDKKIRSLGK